MTSAPGTSLWRREDLWLCLMLGVLLSPRGTPHSVIPFHIPLGKSQAPLLLWGWRLGMGQPPILSRFGVFLASLACCPCFPGL